MFVFISWSGPVARQVGTALRSFIGLVFPHSDVWFSDKDIGKGAFWISAIMDALDDATFGIAVLTPENAGAPWIYFEAGAIATRLAPTPDGARLTPFLFGVSERQIVGPLGLLQATIAEDPEDVWAMVESINRAATKAIPAGTLRELFDLAWPKLDAAMKGIDTSTAPAPPTERRSDSDLLDELLQGQRELRREVGSLTHPHVATVDSPYGAPVGGRIVATPEARVLRNRMKAELPRWPMRAEGRTVSVWVPTPLPEHFETDIEAFLPWLKATEEMPDGQTRLHFEI